ncbi:MAG: hypothetical protein WCB46_06020 [Methanoregula sp.]
MIFFNTALVICVNARLQGRDMSVGEGLSNAQAHFTFIPAIIAVAMQGICVTVLYTYVKTGTVLSAFNGGLIQDAFVRKLAKNIFSQILPSVLYLSGTTSLPDTMSMMNEARQGNGEKKWW